MERDAWAVLVERGAHVERIPIVDVTRLVQLTFIGLLAAAWLLTRRTS
ncbi:MAG: hypothetical protein L0332_29265 [Chloroflexi bacterium]|nr:hypothetical protein [Chloroflexota bacterium]MCI0646830.1 hypothetical protein [Chloroflexota bacterium]MCI0730791.1 hypothetical protein [Chloroflexota bacterium]